jgi:hypothetical protein
MYDIESAKNAWIIDVLFQIRKESDGLTSSPIDEAETSINPRGQIGTLISCYPASCFREQQIKTADIENAIHLPKCVSSVDKSQQT